jgi:atypical dual specificity phosphatase
MIVVVLHSFDFTLKINNAISIFANFSNLIIKRYRKIITNNPDTPFKLHNNSVEFEPLINQHEILFISVDISIESLELIKLSYPESNNVQYKLITESDCITQYPEYFASPDTNSQVFRTSSNASSLILSPYNNATSQFDNNISCILPGTLYLTNYIGASNLELLKSNNITHIINITDLIENYFESELLPTGLPMFTYLKIAIPDAHNIIITDYFLETFEFIDNAIKNGGRILVHCFAGKSRSASIVIGYIMKKEKITFENALQVVQLIRPCVEPNLSFCTQLCKYYNTLDL